MGCCGVAEAAAGVVAGSLAVGAANQAGNANTVVGAPSTGEGVHVVGKLGGAPGSARLVSRRPVMGGTSGEVVWRAECEADEPGTPLVERSIPQRPTH